MTLIEQIGAFLGIAAFLGFAVLVLLYFQQARDVRRLREWAGRAPERAEAAAEEAAAAAAAEAGLTARDAAERGARTAGWRARVPLPASVRERLPHGRYLAIAAGAVVLGAVVLATGAFGLMGGDEDGRGGRAGGAPEPSETTVAVLNGTGVGGAPGVEGLAEAVAKDVKDAGYKVGNVTDAGASFDDSLVMYRKSSQKAAARQVSNDLRKQLGKTDLLRMSDDIKPLAKNAPVAVVIGVQDSQLQ